MESPSASSVLRRSPSTCLSDSNPMPNEAHISSEQEQTEEVNDILQPSRRGPTKWIKVAGAAVVVALAVVLAVTLHLDRHIPQLLSWVESHRTLGSIVFVGFFTIWTGLVLTVGAGAVLDPFWWAVSIVWLGAVCGQTLAFLLGRYLLRDWVAGHARKHRLWCALENAMQDEGWKIALILRLAVVIPFDALNYGFALTPISLKTYVLTSAVGIIPGVCMYCYLGHVVRDMGQIMSGDAKLDPVSAALSLALSAAAVAAAASLITIYTKRALQRMMPAGQDRPSESDQQVLLERIS